MNGYSNAKTWHVYNNLIAHEDIYNRVLAVVEGEEAEAELEKLAWELMGDITPFAEELLELVLFEVNWAEIAESLKEG